MLLNNFYGGNGGDYFDDGCDSEIVSLEVYKGTIDFWGNTLVVITAIDVEYSDGEEILHGKIPDLGDENADVL